MNVESGEKLPLNPGAILRKGGATAKEWLATVLSIGLSVFFIYVGLTHLHECKLQSYMPLALIASGTLFILISLFEIIEEYACPEGGCRIFNKVLITTLWGAKLAVFAFFVYVVATKFEIVNYEKETSPHYCSEWVFMTAMVSVVVTLVSLLVAYFIIPLCQKYVCKTDS